MEFEEIINDLKNKVYQPIYFLMGDEPYYIDKISDFIEENLLDEAMKAFNQTIVYGKDIDIIKIIELCRGFPMMASHKLVIVKEAQDVKKIEDLEKYLSNPLKSTILVVNYKNKGIDQRTKFAKMIIKTGVLFESKKVYDNKLPAWIEKYLSQHNRFITPQASAMMADYIGVDLNRMANELEKLIVALPGVKQFTPEHIEKNIGISKEYNLLELQNALGERNILQANRIINYFGANPGDNPLTRTTSNLYFYFSKLFMYHFLPDKSEQSVANHFSVHPFIAKKLINAARNYSTTKLYEIMGILREYDMKSKGFGGTTSVSDADLHKEMIFKILH